MAAQAEKQIKASTDSIGILVTAETNYCYRSNLHQRLK